MTTSRHTSSDDAPNVEMYKNKKWCLICDVHIISEVYLMSHLRGRRHQESLISHPIREGDAPIIIEANEEPQDNPKVIERIRAGKKRAKKLRHKMAIR